MREYRRRGTCSGSLGPVRTAINRLPGRKPIREADRGHSDLGEGGRFAQAIVLAVLLAGCATVPDQVGGVPVPRIDDTLDAALMTPDERCAEGKRLLATIPDPTREEKLLAIASCAK